MAIYCLFFFQNQSTGRDLMDQIFRKITGCVVFSTLQQRGTLIVGVLKSRKGYVDDQTKSADRGITQLPSFLLVFTSALLCPF